MMEIKVSEHAVIRYLERVKGLDIAAIRKEILTPDRRDAIKAGAKCIRINGIKFPVCNGVIVTVMPTGGARG